MLVLNAFVEYRSENLQVDEYIPLKVNWDILNSQNPRMFWRTGDFSKSLLEIGIDTVTGVIRSITLVSADKVSSLKLDDNLEVATRSQGVPVFEKWNDGYYIDEPHEFEVSLSRNRLSISINDFHEKVNVVESERVLFYFSGNNSLVGIDIINLSEEEYAIIQQQLINS